jgi:hypothetical protein
LTAQHHDRSLKAVLPINLCCAQKRWPGDRPLSPNELLPGWTPRLNREVRGALRAEPHYLAVLAIISRGHDPINEMQSTASKVELFIAAVRIEALHHHSPESNKRRRFIGSTLTTA